MPTALQSLYSHSRKDERNKWVLSLVLNVCKFFEDVTSDGWLFHVFAAATGNARSPIVESRVGGRVNAEADDKRRRCRSGRSEYKGPNIALNERTHLRATERHLSYGITQCYLPPDRGERAPP